MIQLKKTVNVKGVAIGEGAPKICIPMVGSNVSQLREEAAVMKELTFDVIEWRVDFFGDVFELDWVEDALIEIRAVFPEKPLIFTFRTKAEGGMTEASQAFYGELNQAMIATGQVDLIDVELFSDESLIQELLKLAHEAGVAVIISNHEFHKTPPKEEIIARLRKAAELGGDIAKIAVMPTCSADVLTLLDATRTVKEDDGIGPLITMAMGGLGLITRFAGDVFGSDLTFGAAKKASAPGQITAGDLRNVIDLIHRNMPQ